MFTITQDYINQFGINIKNHLLTIKDVNYTVNSTQYIGKETEDVQLTNSSYLTYRVESFISQEAYDAGSQGMPVLSPANGVNPSGNFYIQNPIVDSDKESILELCQNNFAALISGGSDDVAVPYSVTRRQARQQLMLMGLLDDAELAIENITDPQTKSLVSIYWNDSTAFERSNQYINLLASSIGLTQEQLDEAFIAAKKL